MIATVANVGRGRARGPLIALSAAVVAFCGWVIAAAIVAAVSSHPNEVLPSPAAVWHSIPRLAGFQNSANTGGTAVEGERSFGGGLLALLRAAGITAGRGFEGLVIGLVIGGAAGIVLGRIRVLRQLSEFVLLFAALLPLLGMVPLFALWFGETSKGAVIFVAVATFLTAVRTTSSAVANLPEEYADFGRSLGAGSLRAFLSCLPGILPELRAGIRAGVILGFAAEMAAEIFGVQSGLGYLLEAAFRYGHVDEMLAIAIVMAVLGLSAVLVFDAIWAAITRWQE